jgi:hypothetical protein
MGSRIQLREQNGWPQSEGWDLADLLADLCYGYDGHLANYNKQVANE